MEKFKILLNKNMQTENLKIENISYRKLIEIKANYLKIKKSFSKDDYEFLNSLPTAWAGSYIFQKTIENKDKSSIEEWFSIALLHWHGILNLEYLDLQNKKYDPDLKPALENTYPFDPENLRFILFKTRDTNDTIAYYYPQTFYSPSFDRKNWQNSNLLKKFLDKERLNWEKAYQLIKDREDNQRLFAMHILKIIQVLNKVKVTEVINAIKGSFEEILTNLKNFNVNQEVQNDIKIENGKVPTLMDSKKGEIGNDILEKYPLKTKDKKKFFLVNNFKDNWIYEPVWEDVICPSDYKKISSNRIEIKPISANFEVDEVYNLEELLLDETTCFLLDEKEASDSYKYIKNPFLSIIDLEEASSDLPKNPGKKLVLLYPLKSHIFKFLNLDEEDIKLNLERVKNNKIIWKIELFKKPALTWETNAKFLEEASKISLAIWPPKFSADWNFYVIQNFCDPEKEGYFSLINKDGTVANVRQSGKNIIFSFSDTCKSAILRKGDDEELGAVFFKLESISSFKNHCRVCIDFGTSNTCSAFGIEDSKISEVILTLTPLKIFKGLSYQEKYGFIPQNYSAKSSFPSYLIFNTKFSFKESSYKLEDLFGNIDLAALYPIYLDEFFRKKDIQDFGVHSNLKWEAIDNFERQLFLAKYILLVMAELFFEHKLKISEIIFTYPLALSGNYNEFVINVENAVNMVKKVYEMPETEIKIKYIDESTAAACGVGRQAGVKDAYDIIIDLGGGTADIAIRKDENLLLKDSIKFAGETFFNFCETILTREKNNDFSSLFKILVDEERGRLIELAEGKYEHNGLHRFFNYKVQKYEVDFNLRKAKFLKNFENFPKDSYAYYRCLLFFRHLMAYALLQVAGLMMEENGKQCQEKGTILGKVNIILPGNAWKLMIFANLKDEQTLKRDCRVIINIIKEELGVELDIREIIIPKDAKSIVSKGALQVKNLQNKPMESDIPPIIGVNSILKYGAENSYDIKWHYLWGFEKINKKISSILDRSATGSLELLEKEFAASSPFSVLVRIANLTPPYRNLLNEDEISIFFANLRSYIKANNLEGLFKERPLFYILYQLYYLPEEYNYMIKIANLQGKKLSG
jgi:hypothetical protein